jgi:hypothetical protein
VRGRYFAGKLLEAAGIAAVMLGLVQGIYGDMWGDLYMLIGGVAVFALGYVLEKPARTGGGNRESAA